MVAFVAVVGSVDGSVVGATGKIRDVIPAADARDSRLGLCVSEVLRAHASHYGRHIKILSARGRVYAAARLRGAATRTIRASCPRSYS